MSNKKIYSTPIVGIAEFAFDVITTSTLPAQGTDDIGDWGGTSW